MNDDNIRKLRYVVIIVTILYVFYTITKTDRIILESGIKAPFEPIQTELTIYEKDYIKINDFSAIPLYNFDITAKVLSKKKYQGDSDFVANEVMPYDLALGWNVMSDEEVVSKIDIEQRNRWYFWETKNSPVPLNLISNSSANMHIVTDSEETIETLENIKVGQIIRIKGKLIKLIKSGTSYSVTSSTTRKDSGNGGCEVLYTKDIEIKIEE